jgi:hypothetical protein
LIQVRNTAGKKLRDDLQELLATITANKLSCKGHSDDPEAGQRCRAWVIGQLSCAIADILHPKALESAAICGLMQAVKGMDLNAYVDRSVTVLFNHKQCVPSAKIQTVVDEASLVMCLPLSDPNIKYLEGQEKKRTGIKSFE